MKILSYIFLVAIIVSIAVLSIFIKEKNKSEIKYIELKGNYYLSQNEYLKYAHLANKDDYRELSPKIIKDRLEKHPYIKNVDIVSSDNSVTIEIFEKNFEALLMSNSKEYLISDENIVIPRLPNSEKIDFPIINDPYTKSEIVEFSEAQKNNDVKIGLKIITAIKIINPKLYESLSEVNLRAGKDIILQFSTLDVPVVLGRNNEIEKIILFEKLLQKLDYSQIENTLSYIDLRYSQYLYVGKSIDSNTEQESNSWKII